MADAQRVDMRYTTSGAIGLETLTYCTPRHHYASTAAPQHGRDAIAICDLWDPEAKALIHGCPAPHALSVVMGLLLGLPYELVKWSEPAVRPENSGCQVS